MTIILSLLALNACMAAAPTRPGSAAAQNETPAHKAAPGQAPKTPEVIEFYSPL